MKRHFSLSFFLIYLLQTFFVSSSPYVVKTQNLPQIQVLNTKDAMFRSYLQDKEQSNKTGEQSFYSYKYDPNAKLLQNIQEIAARCRTQEVMLSCLNDMNRETNLEGKTLILPTLEGLFFTKDNISSLDSLLFAKYAKELENNSFPCYNIDGVVFYYAKGQRPDPTIEAFYLDSTMKMPLRDYVVTSSFGNRISPITGKKKFHAGVDLAAPLGTQVFSCKAGVVDFCIQNDATFGNYIGIKHKSGQMSIYAHLQGFAKGLKKGENVATGQMIGYVGSTGASTGPHLHFEIKKDGKAFDPLHTNVN